MYNRQKDADATTGYVYLSIWLLLVEEVVRWSPMSKINISFQF